MDSRESTRNYTAELLGISTFVFGVVTMSIFWLTGDHDSSQPGLPDSWAGTVGDLLLPIIVYLLAAGCLRLSRQHTVSPLSLLAGLAGSAGAGASQLAWVGDGAANLNWVLPSSHQLSLAGWYHAIFLIIVSGLISALAIEFILRSRAHVAAEAVSQQANPTLSATLSSDGAAVFVACSMVFITTVWLDSREYMDTAASIATVLLILSLPVAVLAVALVMIGRQVRYLIGPLLIGAVLAATILTLLTHPLPIEARLVFPVLSSFFVGIAAYMILHRAAGLPADRVPLRSVTVLVLPAIVLMCAAHGMPWGLLIAFATVTTAMLVYHTTCRRVRLVKEAKWDVRDGLILVATLVTVNCIAASLPAATGTRAIFAVTLAVAVAFAIGRVVTRFGFRSWRHMIRAERLAGTTENHHALVRTTAWTWSLAALVLLGSLLALVPIVAEAASLDLSTGAWLPSARDAWYLLGGAVSMSLLGIRSIIDLSRRPESFKLDIPTLKDVPSLVRLSPAYASLVLALPFTVWLIGSAPWYGVSSWIALIVSAVAFAHTVETTIANSIVLSWSHPIWLDVVLASWAALAGSIALFYGLNGGGGLETNIAGAFILFICVIVYRVAILLTCAGVVYARIRWASGTIWPASWTMVQDEIVRSFVILFVAWLPIIVIRKTPGDTEVALVAVGFTLLTMLLLLTEVFRFGFARWLRHGYEQRKYRFEGRHSIEEPEVGSLGDVWKCALNSTKPGIKFFRPRWRRRGSALSEEDYLVALSSHLGMLVALTIVLTVSTVAGIIAFAVAMAPNYTLERLRDEEEAALISQARQ